MTLEELKQKNAQAEFEQQAAQPVKPEDAELQAKSAEPVGGDPDDTGEEAQDVPLWMQADEQESASDQMPVKSHIAVKQKLKGRLNQKDSELDELRQEIQKIKAVAQPVASPLQETIPAQTAMPKSEDFYDSKDPDAAYQAAMQNWVSKGVEDKLNAHLQTQQQQQHRQQLDSRISQELDRHYDRAAKIVGEGMLTVDEYRDSEAYLRQSVDQVSPGNGDAYVDSLLGRMGDGSEKVVISLARNTANMTAFQQALRDDPTGISAAAYLGELKGRFTGATRVSKTPKPGSPLNGDASTEGGADARRYKAAHKSGNRQEAFNIKRAAKGRGVDVSKW